MIPVIFLTNPDDRTLPLIKKELQGLTRKFEESSFKDQINIQWRSDISPDSFSSVARNYQYRIVVFHYAGHADAKNLVFSEENATAEGIARFFETETNLSLVFLNGCSTEGQVNHLFKKGIPAVIATRHPVLDSKAAKFAYTFYQEWINNNKTLGQAFLNAFNEGNLTTHATENPIQRAMGLISFEDPPFYRLYIHKDYPWVEHLSFKELIRNPLIGVPPVRNAIALKSNGENHFKGLKPLQQEDAWVFFGRNREIKSLYEYIADQNTNEALLLYGKSGVGKSSLLQAGLLSRLSENTTHLLRVGESNLSFLAEKSFEEINLLILDQFEKILELPQEEHLSVASILREISQKNTKLIFSFRKDYLAEILHLIETWELPYRRFFLSPLSSNFIKEIIASFHKIKQENKDYTFIEPEELGSAIAAHLKDVEGSVAPIFQLLMKKMYSEAMKDQGSQLKKLDEHLFKRVAERGLHIKDYLKDEIELIDKNSEFKGKNFGKSGLVLDLLYFLCESNYSLTKSVLFTDVLEEYKNIPSCSKLLDHLKDRYLILINEHQVLENNEKKTHKYVRLMHDALAKEVNRQFEISQLPGPKARRILQAKLKEKDNLLNRKEYNWVKAGLSGRGSLSQGEANLLDESKKALQKEVWKSATLILVPIMVIALSLWWVVIKKPEQIKTQLDIIQTEIELGNWENVKIKYEKVLKSKQGKEHFLATLIYIPQLTSANQIIELSRLSKSSIDKNSVLSRQIRAVTAFWLSYSPAYWDAGKQLMPQGVVTINTQEDLRQMANSNLPPYFQDSIRNFFPEFTEINPPANTIDECSSNKGNKMVAFKMSTKEISIQQFQIYLNLSQAPNENYEGVEWEVNKQSWEIIEEKDPMLPMELTFEHAKAYCNWADYQIPTTQQWEIATMDFLSVEQFTTSFIEENQEIIGQPGPGLIGSSLPNNKGLYDLLGNVSEWVVNCDGTQTTRGGSYRMAIRRGDIKRTAIMPGIDPFNNFSYGKGFRPIVNTIDPL